MGISKFMGKIIDDLAKIMGKDIISLGDAAVGDVKSGKKFYAGSTTLKTGTLPTKAIVAGAETYEEGYHAGNPGGLSAIETDLVVGNIKKDVNIFGKVGTYDPIPTITEELAATTLEDISLTTSWVTKLTESIPATATKVLLWAVLRGETSYTNQMRILYNGVERAVDSATEGDDDQASCHWQGDGVGSVADFEVQCKSTSSISGQVASWGAWSIP